MKNLALFRRTISLFAILALTVNDVRSASVTGKPGNATASTELPPVNTCVPPSWGTYIAAATEALSILVTGFDFVYYRCKEGAWETLQKLMRVFCFLNFIIFWLAFAILFVVIFAHECSEEILIYFGKNQVTKIIVFVTIMVIAWLFMLFECLICEERYLIKKIVNMDDFNKHIETMKNTPPTIDWNMVASHHEKRNILEVPCTIPEVKKYDSKEYVYNYWMDHSPTDVGKIGKVPMAKVILVEEITAGNAETALHMGKIREQFRKSFEGETRIDISEVRNIRGFQQKMMVAGSEIKWYRFHSETVFWFMSVLTFTWLYRAMFYCKTKEVRYVARKKIYKTEPEIDGRKTREYGKNYTGTSNGPPGGGNGNGPPSGGNGNGPPGGGNGNGPPGGGNGNGQRSSGNGNEQHKIVINKSINSTNKEWGIPLKSSEKSPLFEEEEEQSYQATNC